MHESLFFRHAPHDGGTPALEVERLGVTYDGRVALDDVTFSVARGERVAVVGPNGAGKTTLFNAVSGLLSPDRGDVRVFGHGPRGHICIAHLVQRSRVDWSFPVTVADAVMMGRAAEIGLFRHPGHADRAFVRGCLEQVGIADLATRQIGQLSGGQQQRMFIARALAQEAQLMLMDEPFTGLDPSSQSGILSVLEGLSRQNVAILVATHDLNLAAEHFDRVLLLNRHLVGIGKPAEVFTPERIFEVFGGRTGPIQTAHGTWLIGDTCCGGGVPDGGTE
jgi:manganese/iron transport system ATP-binding protein